MAITALPTPPSRSDPANFADRGDEFLGALPAFQSEANALATDVTTKQGIASSAAETASAAAAAATSAANATEWVSGTTYAEGVVVFSPITYLSYRRKSAGAGTTDPSIDSANYAQVAGTGDVSLTGAQELTNKTIRKMVIIVSANANASKSNIHVFTASATLTLPATPNVGDYIEFKNNSGTTTPVIARNGENIMSLAEDLTLNDNNASGFLTYADATRGWVLT